MGPGLRAHTWLDSNSGSAWTGRVALGVLLHPLSFRVFIRETGPHGSAPSQGCCVTSVGIAPRAPSIHMVLSLVLCHLRKLEAVFQPCPAASLPLLR